MVHKYGNVFFGTRIVLAPSAFVCVNPRPEKYINVFSMNDAVVARALR
jgi:hypothetical protein